jgi:hypothetical protein
LPTRRNQEELLHQCLLPLCPSELVQHPLLHPNSLLICARYRVRFPLRSVPIFLAFSSFCLKP